MSKKQNADKLRAHLIEVRGLVEPHANQPDVKDRLVVLDTAIGPYVDRIYAGEFEITEPVLRIVEAHLVRSREAAARGSWKALMDSSKAMISALPGDPFTMP